LSAETTIFQTRARRPRQSVVVARRLAITITPIVVLAVIACLVFAGTPSTLAAGTSIHGVDVGGLSPQQAIARLEARAAAVENVPVVFTAAGREFRFSASQLGVRSDWAHAVATARRDGGGF
jgi:hypothetical protein